MRKINKTEDGRCWLTDKQLEELYDQLLSPPSRSLVEANEAVQKLLYRTQVDVNELTGEQYPDVYLIDFHHPERNHFLAINQFRIDTPGGVKDFIIPDIVLFVNGIPLAVIECKDANDFTSNPMFEAFQQFLRYSDQREETRLAGLREGEPRLFYTNQFLIRTCGDKAEFGTITSTDEEFFYPWRDIYPEKYRNYTPPLGTARPQEVLIQGMLPKETLLDLVRTCTVFMDVGKVRAKVVARYQQYRAVQKIIHRLRTGNTPDDRSGVIWHTQGSGKSLTMVFAIRKLRMCEDLKDFKVCLINDRKDLEEAVGGNGGADGRDGHLHHQFRRLAGEAGDRLVEPEHGHGPQVPGVRQRPARLPGRGAEGAGLPVLRAGEPLGTHPADDRRGAPHPVRRPGRQPVRGVPLRHAAGVHRHAADRRQGQEDHHRAVRAVYRQVQVAGRRGRRGDGPDPLRGEDGGHGGQGQAPVRRRGGQGRLGSMSSPRSAKPRTQELLAKIAEKQNRPFDDLVRERTDEEILALKQKWGTTGDLLEAEQRIEAIAADIVKHYVENILPNGFKAQVVCSSKMAAVHYKNYIDKALAARLAAEQAKPVWTGDPHDLTEDNRAEYRDDDLCRRIAFLKSVVVVSSEGTNERAVIVQARKHAQAVDAVENFKRKFDLDDPEKVNTGIAFLIVCDMLLTGFDAPIEQVMYIDKKVKNHDLLQTIARVNRVAKGKSRGYIVDYIGLTDHLREALSIYAADDQKDLEDSLKDITSEIPVLETRYRRLVNLFTGLGVAEIEGFAQQTIADPEQAYDILEQAVEAMEDLQQRANFEVYLKKFMQSMDIILPNAAANPYKIPVKRFGYLLVKVKERYKDDSLSISGAGEKVRKLIDEHLISLGINPKIKPVELMSPKFIQEVEKHKSSKAKASEMEHAIRKHCKVHLEEDPVLYSKLSEKLEALIKEYKDNWDLLYQHLFTLRGEAEAGRRDEIEGVSRKAVPFYDLIGLVAFGR